MGSLIRATAMWGYPELVRELGGDPDVFLARFHIPAGAEHHEDAFISVGSVIRILEASADDLRCPDFGLRLSALQGLHILGPIAVIARNAQTVLGGMEAIARFLYIHSPALVLTARQRTETGIEFTYETTESDVPYMLQGYELSMGIAVRILRLLAGPDAAPRAISFLHKQRGPDAAYRDALGCPVRFAQTWCGFELPAHLADRRIDNADPETRRIATKYLESTYLPGTAPLSDRVAELTRTAAANRPVQRRGHCRRAGDASADAATAPGRRGRALSGHHRARTARPRSPLPRRAGAAPQPDRGPARLYGTKRAQSLVPALVRTDTAAIPSGPGYAGVNSTGRALGDAMPVRRHGQRVLLSHRRRRGRVRRKGDVRGGHRLPAFAGPRRPEHGQAVIWGE